MPGWRVARPARLQAKNLKPGWAAGHPNGRQGGGPAQTGGRQAAEKQLGKVKWISAEHGNSGVLSTIGGADLRFTCPDGAFAAKALAPGQLVSFEVAEGGLSSDEVRAEPVAHVRSAESCPAELRVGTGPA